MTDGTVAETLYERVGGTESVKALVEELHERLLADDRLTHIFSRVEDMAHLRAHTVRMLVTALGGPDDYRGRDMASAHAGYPIGDTEFGIVVEHIEGAAGALGVPTTMIGEIVEILAPLRAQVVQV